MTSIVRNLFFLFSITLFGITSFVLATFNYNPFTSKLPVFMNFYGSFFIAVAGILAISIFYFKSRQRPNSNSNDFFWPSARQASLVSLALTALLALKGLKMLDLLIGLSIVIVVFLSELFFRTKKSFK
jgi:hypothetical protein